MLGFFKKDKPTRSLESVFDLRQGDIITLKHKRYLPEELAGHDFTIEKVTTYQYEYGNVKELVIKSANDSVYFLSVDANDGDTELCISKRVPRSDVLKIFDADDFAEIFEGDGVELQALSEPEKYTGWVAERYMQSSQGETGFFYDQDCEPDEYTAGGEEFRLYEFEGIPDSHSLSVEVYGDGTTEVFLEVCGGSNMIDQMWPGK